MLLTSQTTIYKFIKQSQLGFTLIELMIVLGLIAALVGFSLTKLRPADKAKAVVRRITVLTKQTFINARLKNQMHRFVINLDEKNPNIIIESATKSDVQAFFSEEDEKKAHPDEKAKSDYTPDGSILKKPLELPSGYKFLDVEYGTKKEKISTGKAYIYFFPQGFATHAAIHISDGKDKKFTVIIQPLTGQSFASPDYVSLQEFE